MKTAANVIAVAGWLGFLAAMWWPMVTGAMPPVGAWVSATVVSLLVGMIIPGYLLNLEDRLRPSGRGGRGE